MVDICYGEIDCYLKRQNTTEHDSNKAGHDLYLGLLIVLVAILAVRKLKKSKGA